jgi:superfamily II DNA/RNA helicase
MPGPIVALTRSFMHRPVRVRADNSSSRATHATTTQIVFQSHRLDRVSVLARILQTPGRGRTIVFARTKRSAAMVAEDLAGLGFRVGAVHGDMRQNDRERSLDAFRDGSVDIMVATDVAARGIDVEDVTHVINYQVPEDEKTYVHRIGRTGRAGHSGVAVTLVDWDDLTRWQAIDDTLNLGHPAPPRWFSTSPEFLAEFDLPEEVTDRVGRAVRVQGSAAATAPARRDRDNRGGRRDRKAARR